MVQDSSSDSSSQENMFENQININYKFRNNNNDKILKHPQVIGGNHHNFVDKQKALNINLSNINNNHNHNNSSPEGSIAANEEKEKPYQRPEPPPAPPNHHNHHQQHQNLLNVDIPNTYHQHYNHNNYEQKDAPCTPSSSTDASDDENDFKYNFQANNMRKYNNNMNRNMHIHRQKSMDTTPPPQPALLQPGAPISCNNSNEKEFIMAVSEILMQHYPLHTHKDVLQQQLDAKNFNQNLYNLKEILSKYDYINKSESEYYYIVPQKLETELCVSQRQKIIKNKMKFLLDTVNNDGIDLRFPYNNDLFFNFHIGWKPTDQDNQFLSELLSQNTPKYRNVYGVKPVRRIMSYKQMLICALSSTVCCAMYIFFIFNVNYCDIT